MQADISPKRHAHTHTQKKKNKKKAEGRRWEETGKGERGGRRRGRKMRNLINPSAMIVVSTKVLQTP